MPNIHLNANVFWQSRNRNILQVKSQLKEKLNELPTQEELQKKADSFIAQLPKYKVSLFGSVLLYTLWTPPPPQNMTKLPRARNGPQI